MNDPRLISPRRAGPPDCALWGILLLSAGIPRVLAAFLLPNEEGDPYSYFRAIQMMRDSIAGGTFTPSELFGFWLPLYQFICALISVVVGHPLYVAKIFSAVCGAGVCLLVFVVSMRVTASRMLSIAAFALIAFNPVHIMYSAFSMSDVPYAFLVMASLYFAIKDRWMVAASFVAAGGLMRPEAWLFIGLLPALQWFLHRRLSLATFLIVLSAPMVWMYISWAATGHPLEYFNVRSNYIRELLAEDPGLSDFSPSHVAANLKTLMYSAGPAVLVAALIAAWFLVKRGASEASQASVATAAYFFASLGFLLFAYFTKNQPAIFARYCLVLFALGLPLLAWTLSAARQWTPARALMLTAALFALCLWQFIVQFRDGVNVIDHVSQKRIVANCVREGFHAGSNARVFCDDDTVRVLAGIPEDSFVGSSGSPGDAESFLSYLKENRVEYLVYAERGKSAAVMLFQDLGQERIKEHFQLVAATKTDLRVYRTVF